MSKAIRRFLLALFLLTVLGTGAELLLLGHYEETWQLVPLLLMSVSIVTLLGYAAARRAAALRIFQGTMILFVVSGGLGVVLHYLSNVEFELEMHPSLGGLNLFWESLQGAMPVIAPGTMVQLGLLGLLYSYQHPRLTRPAGTDTNGGT